MADGQKTLARVALPLVMVGLVIALGVVLFRGKPAATAAPQNPDGTSQAAGDNSKGTTGNIPSIGGGAINPGYTGPLSAKPQAVEQLTAIGSLAAP